MSAVPQQLQRRADHVGRAVTRAPEAMAREVKSALRAVTVESELRRASIASTPDG